MNEDDLAEMVEAGRLTALQRAYERGHADACARIQAELVNALANVVDDPGQEQGLRRAGQAVLEVALTRREYRE